MKCATCMVLVLVWLGPSLPVAAQSDPPPSLPPEVELEELRMVVRTLAEENRRLKAKIAELQAASSLAVPSNPVPPSPAQPVPDVPTQPRTAEPAAASAQVLYVNPTWHYLVVNRGSTSGVEKQQTLSVIRNGVLIAHGTVTEVKPGQSVAEIDLESLGAGGLYPKTGDLVQAR